MSYGEPQVDAPVDHGKGGDAPGSGNKPAGYDEASRLNGAAWTDHEIGSCWTPLEEAD